jgi:hypothetical protein
MTLYQGWNGRKPSVSHFKVVGCIDYSHVPHEKRKKLDDERVKCIFIGYYEETKAYILYNPQIEILLVSCYVFFDEK